MCGWWIRRCSVRPGTSPDGMSPRLPPGAHPPSGSIASIVRAGGSVRFVRRRPRFAGCWTGGRVAPGGRRCLPSAWTWGSNLTRRTRIYTTSRATIVPRVRHAWISLHGSRSNSQRIVCSSMRRGFTNWLGIHAAINRRYASGVRLTTARLACCLVSGVRRSAATSPGCNCRYSFLAKPIDDTPEIFAHRTLRNTGTQTWNVSRTCEKDQW